MQYRNLFYQYLDIFCDFYNIFFNIQKQNKVNGQDQFIPIVRSRFKNLRGLSYSYNHYNCTLTLYDIGKKICGKEPKFTLNN